MELILDQNKDMTFCSKEYPVFSVATNETTSFDKLKKLAAEILQQSQNQNYIILSPSQENDMLYLLTVALRLEADKILNAPSCAILKVLNLHTSLELYKKYVALTTGISYITRLAEMNIDDMLRDIRTLSYLGLDIQTDYLQNTVTLSLNGIGKEHVFNVSNKEKAVLLSALLKTFSMLDIHPKAKVCLDLNKVHKANHLVNSEKLIPQLIKISSFFIQTNKTAK